MKTDDRDLEASVPHRPLGEKQKGLEYNNRALSIRRQLRGSGNEADTLTNIGVVYSDLGEKQKASETTIRYSLILLGAVCADG